MATGLKRGASRHDFSLFRGGRVEREEMRDAVGVGGKGPAVELVDQGVEPGVRLRQLRRHRQRVVQVGQRALGVARPRVQHGLRRLRHRRLPRLVRLRPDGGNPPVTVSKVW